MATLVTRSGKGSPLTHAEVDANFTNLNTDKLELSGGTMTGNLSFGDNDKAIFGAGSDLQIYHDGSNSYILDNGIGGINIQGYQFIKINNVDGSKTSASFNVSGPVLLNHNNAAKLATTSTGVDITGTLTSDALTVEGNGSLLTLDNGSNPTTISNTNGNVTLDFDTTNAGRNFTIEENGNNALRINGGGDISFYEDTGTTAKFFWDASAESLGIGTSSPQYLGHFVDGDVAIVGTDATNNSEKQSLLFGGASGESAGLAAITGYRGANATHGELLFKTNNGSGIAEAARIDSSGNLLVGKTSAGTATSGFQTGSDGFTGITRDGDIPLRINRETDDGTIIDLRKDNTTVGSITTKAGAIQMCHTSIGVGVSADNLYPTNGSGAASDNTVDIGDSTARFKDLYLSGGVYLGGTGSANKLDDYEEGTWTPSYTSAGSNAITATYDIRVGRYVKVGNMVKVTFRIRTDSVSGGSSDTLRVTGLPFSSANISSLHYGAAIGRRVGWGNKPATAYVQTNSTYLLMIKNGSEASGTLTETNDLATSTNDNDLDITVVYQTA